MPKKTTKPAGKKPPNSIKNPRRGREQEQKQKTGVRNFVSQEVRNAMLRIKALQKLETGLQKTMLGLTPKGDMGDLVKRLKKDKDN